MKKSIFATLFIAVIMLLSAGEAKAQQTGFGNNDGGGSGLGPTTEVEIMDGILSGGTKPIRPRSAMPTVTAMIDYSFDEIEVNFNEDLGVVAVVITDQTGQNVYGISCNTIIEPVVCLPLPIYQGLFKISIIGEAYRGEGSFNL